MFVFLRGTRNDVSVVHKKCWSFWYGSVCLVHSTGEEKCIAVQYGLLGLYPNLLLNLLDLKTLHWQHPVWYLYRALPYCSSIKNQCHSIMRYRAFHRFKQAKFPDGGLVLGSSQYSVLLQLPPKMMLSLKEVKIDSKISNSLS